MPLFNPEHIKNDFPIFANNPGLVYLDSAASAQRPRQVLDAMRAYHEEYNANIHRGIYRLSERATAAYETAREKIAKFIDARESAEIIFTHNATESINLVASSWGRTNLREGDEILTSQMEHHANIVPWQMLTQQLTTDNSQHTTNTNSRYQLKVTKIKEDFTLDVDDFKQKLESGRVKLVALTHVSNVLGAINPVKELTQLAHEAGALVLIDGAQAVPHLSVNVQNIDADFYVFSGHKMLGPTGIGVLYAKRELLEAMPPYQGGGEMIAEVTFEHTTFKEPPHKFEAGTPHIAGAIGLGAAIDYLQTFGMKNVRQYEIELTKYALDRIRVVGGMTQYGPTNPAVRGGVIAFTLPGVHPHDIASIFDEHNIAIRAGHHCAMPLHKHLGLPATARMSFYIYNTKEDVDRAIETIEKIKKMFS